MSLTSSPDCLFRPEDKALRMLFPSIEESNSLDDFVNDNLYGLDCDETYGRASSGVLDQTSTIKDSNPWATRLPSLNFSPEEDSSPQPWRKGLWCLNQKQEPRGLHRNISGTQYDPKAIIETTELMIPSDFAARSPISSPKTPLFREKKKVASSTGAMKRRTHHVHHNVTREVTLSPSPMYAQLSNQERIMRHGDKWQQDFQNFHLRPADQALPISSASSAGIQPHRPSTRYLDNDVTTRDTGIGLAITTPYIQRTTSGLTSPFRSAIDPRLTSAEEDSVDLERLYSQCTQPQSRHANHMNYQPPTGPVWTTENLYSSNSSDNSYDTQNHILYSAQDGAGILWASPKLYPQIPLAPQECSPSFAAPKPRKLRHHIVQSQMPDMEYTARGMPYSDLDQMSEAVVEEPYGRENYCRHGPPGGKTVYHNIAEDTYPPIPVQDQYIFSNPSPFQTPHRLCISPTQFTSPSISPTNTSTLRVRRQRSPTRTDHSHVQHTRRKSLHRSGPIKDTSHLNEPIPPLFPNDDSDFSLSKSQSSPTKTKHSRSRSRSRPRSATTPKTPRTPTSKQNAATPTPAATGIGFVNLTPKDSAKLLSDVAPSGSSRTRARREQEAREKRKKFNEAAIKAVISAGGDLRSLEGVILT